VSRPYGLYPSVIQLFLAAFYRYNREYLEIYSTTGVGSSGSGLALLPIDAIGKTIIEMVESPTKYLVRYQPLMDTQRQFLRGLVERALCPNRVVRSQAGEAASLRNQIATLLQQWTNDISLAARRASEAELSSILDGVTSETISASIALMEIASKPSIPEIADALLNDLPIRLGLPSDSSQWTEPELDKTLTILEIACQQLSQFPKKFKSDMAWQIGQCFGLTEPPKNWNDTLKAAQEWRTQSIGSLRELDLDANRDARNLLYVIDDNPYNFEQAFLNALASRWGLLPFEQWQTLSIRGEYLQRLEQAKAAAEHRVAELGLSSTQTTTPDPATSTTNNITATTRSVSSSKSSASSIANSVNAKARSANSPNGSAASTTNSPAATTAPANTTTRATTTKARAVTAQYKSHPGSQQLNGTTTASGQVQGNGSSHLVDQALTQVKAIFGNLSPQDQYALWQRLKEEYDPQ
jgi:hypothetical protein